MLMASSGLNAEKLYDVECDNITGDEECQVLLPYCSKYTVYGEDEMEEVSNFVCTECEPGFEPVADGIKNIPRNYNLPDLKRSGLEFLQLCKRIDTPVEGVNCNSHWCRKELPFCYKYKFTKENDKFGYFECLECDPLFDTRGKLETSKATNFYQIKRTCTRKMEIRECGEICQEELPGCKKYMVSNKMFTTYDSVEIETAEFECLEPLEGYEIMSRFVRSDTNPGLQKETTLASFQSTLQSCSDIKCRHALPYCLKYVTNQQTGDFVLYTCQECQVGYKPKVNYRAYGSISHMARNSQFAMVCEAVEIDQAKCDSRCQQEIPGCLTFSIYNPNYNLGISIQTAKYACNVCAEGYEGVMEIDDVVVHSDFNVLLNTKVRCRPLDVSQPTPCDDYCRRKYPHCLKYTAQKDDFDPPSEENFRCHQCDEGYEPTSSGDSLPWFAGYERVVCKRKATGEIFTCDSTCQKEFPGCEQMSITNGKGDHNSYQCHKCSEGKFPIPYEKGNPGKLGYHDSIMRNSNTLYLCAEKKSQMYLSLYTCQFKDPNIFDHIECFDQRNCQRIVSMRDLDTGVISNRCVLCKNGFQLKANPPHYYDIDQDQCEALKLASNHRLFTATA